jgi:16S rRNA (adenine1518-N6/adenine1519-N6)-dimethyltransferase
MFTHRAKKSLGQNFLKSELALKKIVEAGEIKKGDIILEIGPGRGALTEKLLEKSRTVVAVEKDRELFQFLKIKFEKEITEKKLILINYDILNFNVDLRNYKIIANIPYNITGAILKKFLSAENQPERMILMVQHEVAKRIVASDPRHRGAGNKESILSISVKAYGEPKIIMKVSKRYFSPAPKVDSAIIAIKNISRQTFNKNSVNEEKFWEIVKTGFAHKRKKLSSNLKNLSQNGVCGNLTSKENLKNKRAEDLSLTDWIMLAKS